MQDGAERPGTGSARRGGLGVIAGAGAGLLLAAVALIYVATPERQAPAAPEPAAAPPAEEAVAPLPAPILPSFDTVRAEADGALLVAGRAAPDVPVTLLIDNQPAATGQSGADGTFAILHSLPPSDQPRSLVLSTPGPEDKPLLSAETIVLAPRPAETAVAEATPEPAPAAPPAVLISDAEGVRAFGPPAPGVMGDITLDTIAYDSAGEVSLSGRAAPDTAAPAARVYVDNAPLLDAPIAADGTWQADLANVTEGNHTLRVDQVGPDGTVTSRFETPFLRESSDTLAAHPTAQAVIVQPGATLWRIARDRYGEGTLYVRVFEANRAQIRDPDLIYPGQVFRLPD